MKLDNFGFSGIVLARKGKNMDKNETMKMRTDMKEYARCIREKYLLK